MRFMNANNMGIRPFLGVMLDSEQLVLRRSECTFLRYKAVCVPKHCGTEYHGRSIPGTDTHDQ